MLRRSINGMAERLESLVGAITSERDRDRAMIGSLAEGVLTVAPDGTVTVANDAASRYLGLPGDAGPARLDALPIIDAVLAARADEASEARPRQVTLPDGVELELAVSRLGEGKHAGTVITLRDVTAQRQLDARRDPGGQRVARAEDADRGAEGVPRAAGGRRRGEAPGASSSRR